MFPSRQPPPDVEAPYTEITNSALLGIKPRVVECVYCHYFVVTDLPAPMCGKCKHSLITVPKWPTGLQT